ncbi:unnamed protein product [Pneumocystis jirovecii]|uniref:Uncharacterized protein n=1 Tax=Pneumocystis jirovecii TaxID=42068 RepID=L0PBG9_PNEJI|nr:unnamed protein product [Pneumocystis jirovecii]
MPFGELNDLVLASKLTITGEFLLGLISTGFMITGDGKSICILASTIKEHICVNYDAVTKSCMAAIIGSPLRGVTRLFFTLINSIASARASSVCGTCRFISSPSKSALYGLQTHSLSLKVFHGRTFT